MDVLSRLKAEQKSQILGFILLITHKDQKGLQIYDAI